MVTSLTEGRHKMCEQYWPDSGTAEYGPFMVTLVETQVFADYAIRTFQLLVSPNNMCYWLQNKKHNVAWVKHVGILLL